MFNSKTAIKIAVITLCIVLIMLSMLFSCKDDDLEPQNVPSTIDNISGNSTTTTNQVQVTVTTDTASNYDLSIGDFKLWGTINQTVGSYLGGYKVSADNRDNHITGKIENLKTGEAPACRILVEVMPKEQTDWNTYAKTFAVISSPITGIPGEKAMYLAGDKVFYKIFGFENGEYKARARIIKTDSYDAYSDLNASNNMMESEETFTLKGAGNHDVWIITDGAADTEMYLFSDQIVYHRYRNGPKLSDTEPTKTRPVISQTDFDEYMDSNSIDQEYLSSNIKINALLLDYVDDNAEGYTSTNPMMRKWLPSGTYFIKIQGAYKKEDTAWVENQNYDVKIVSGKRNLPIMPTGWYHGGGNIGPKLDNVDELVYGGGNAYVIKQGDTIAVKGNVTDSTAMWFKLTIDQDTTTVRINEVNHNIKEYTKAFVDVTAGSPNIVGNGGTTWVTDGIKVDQIIAIYNGTTYVYYTIAEVTDETHIKLSQNYSSTTGAAINYKIITEYQWIEIYNNSTEAVDISGWSLYAGPSNYYTIPSGTSIANRGYVIIHWYEKGTKYSNHIYTGVDGNATFLDQNGDDIALFNDDNFTSDSGMIHYVRYKDAGSTNDSDMLNFALKKDLWGLNEYVQKAANGYTIQYDNNGYSQEDWSNLFTPTIGAKNLNYSLQ